MDGAATACWFAVSPGTFVKTLYGIVEKLGTGRAKAMGAVALAAIVVHHQTYGAFVRVQSFHRVCKVKKLFD